MAIIDLSAKNIVTNAKAIGSSVVQAYTGRDLTSGEIAMCSKIFGKSIPYSEAKVHGHGAYWVKNPDGNAVTPNGEIYFNSSDYQTDFSAASVSAIDKAWFIHEMTHVWQHFKGFPVRRAGAYFHLWGAIDKASNVYKYLLPIGIFATFSDYNLEAQANLVQDYFAIFILGSEQAVSWQNRQYIRGQTAKQAILKKLVEDFKATGCAANQVPSQPLVLGMVRES